MALIQNHNCKKSDSYTRLLGNAELGRLVSRIHGAVIGSGIELERMINQRANSLENLDEFLELDIYPQGVFVASKRQIKKSKIIDTDGNEPDFVIFERCGKKQHCYIIELKDGEAFDTKKSAGERENLHSFQKRIAPLIKFPVSVHCCCFHAKDKKSVYDAFKKRIVLNEAMTGREFCDLLKIDYDEIINIRKEHQKENLNFVISELLKIDVVRISMEEGLSQTQKNTPHDEIRPTACL